MDLWMDILINSCLHNNQKTAPFIELLVLLMFVIICVLEFTFHI